MKTYSLLIITILLCLVHAACKKDSAPGINGVNAKKDNVDWKSSSVSTGFKPLATKDTLFIFGKSGEENIIITLVQKGKGTYTANEIKANFYATIGSDVLLGSYHLADVPNNKVVITDYDENSHTLKGSFNLVFKRTHGESVPDTLRFTDGKINTQLTAQYLDPYRGF